MKTCKICNTSKNESCFYPNRLVCKPCYNQRVMAYSMTEKGATIRKAAKARYRSSEHGFLKEKEYRELPHRVEAMKVHRKKFTEAHPGIGAIYKKSYYAKYPEKRAAHEALRYAVRSGKIEKPNNCETCGKETGLHGHHDDYYKPLDVQWLCPECHIKLHREERHQNSISRRSLRRS